MSKPSAYTTRPALIPEERSAILDLWRGNLGEGGRMERKFQWFYEQAPTGAPLTLFLECRTEADGSPVRAGVASAGRREFQLDAERLSAGVLVDMAVRQEHRTLGPALQLQKGLLATALQTASFVYGFPNPKAAPVFQRVGYQRLGMMRRHVRVLRASSYLARSRPAWQARVIGPVADAALRAGLGLRAVAARAPQLVWRPVEQMPDIPVCYRPDAAGMLLGIHCREFLLWRFAGGRPGQYVHIAPEGVGDYWIAEDQGDVLQLRDCTASLLAPEGRAQWLALFRDAERRGYHSVSFECLAPAPLLQTLVGLGMQVRSERPVFWAAAAGMAGRIAASKWFLTSADEDE